MAQQAEPRRKGRRRTATKALAAVGLTAWTVASPSGGEVASAYELTGCRWPGSNPRMDYWMGFGDSDYVDATTTADSRWDAWSNVPGYFNNYNTVFPTTEHEVLISIQAQGNTDVYATVSYSCTSSGGGPFYYDAPLSMVYNTTEMNQISNDHKRVIGVHEFGHVVGLDEETTTGCNGNNTGIMYEAPLTKYEECGWNNLQADDRNGVRDVY